MYCLTLDEVRSHIDQIDDEIIQHIALRGQYVLQAAGFKQNRKDVSAAERVETVISQVRKKAVSYGADADLVEQIYRNMIAGFIQLELKKFENR